MRSLAALALCSLCGCARGDYPHLYRSQPLAPGYAAAEVAALQHLGATMTESGVNFSVYSEHATKIELAVFDGPDSDHPARQFDMTRFGDAWNVFVEGLGQGTIYGYIAWGPNWPYVDGWQPGTIGGFIADVDAAGNRFDPNKLLFDPYSRAFTRDHDWSKGSTASGPERTQLDWGGAAKSVVVQSGYAWSANETAWRAMRRSAAPPVGHRWQDLIVYEVHPKGFTADPASGATHPGTYRGIGERADYFKDLGINAVELMPVFEKPSDGGYWGYQTVGFFAPELTYSSDRRPGMPMDEFKWMVDQLHQRGLEVILDVVYNHTGEGGLWRDKISQDVSGDPIANLSNFDPKEVAGLYSFRGLDNAAYYALQSDPGFYVNDTGVGDMTRCNHAPMQRLILDSLHYWVEEMHVDGFRFDLAPILGEDDLKYQTFDPTASMLQAIVDDPVLLAWNARVIAEPWSLASYLGRFPSSTTQGGVGWYEWNGGFRDWWREFANWDQTRGEVRPQDCHRKQCNSDADCADQAPLTHCDGGGVNSSHLCSFCVSNVDCANGAVCQNDKTCAGQPIQACGTNYFSLHGTEYGKDGGAFMTGSYDMFHWNQRRPYHSVNFITVHDGFTLYDSLSYARQLNGCSPLNPVCCDSPASPFCDPLSGESNNRSRNWTDESFKRQQIRNLLTAMMIAPGTPMLLGGDEWMRTQLGNNNAYTTGADNPFNWFDWGSWQADPARVKMHAFVQQLLRFRKDHSYAFAPADYGAGAPMQWKSEALGPPNWDLKHIAQLYADASTGPQLFVMINMESGNVTFQLPPGIAWTRLLDTQSYFEDAGNFTLDQPAVVSGGSYGVVGHSIVVLQAAPQ